MSKKIKIMICVTVIVVMFSLVADLYIMMPACDYCGSKFCKGECLNNPSSGSTGVKAPASTGGEFTALLGQTALADAGYLDRILFIGDSRTEGLAQNGIDEKNIMADTGLTHEQAMTKAFVELNGYGYGTIADGVSERQPEIAIVNFGVNSVGWTNEEDFIAGYEKFMAALENVSPDTIFIIEEIYPVTETYEYNSANITNNKIDVFNKLLYQLADRSGYYYLATNDVLRDDVNALQENYSSDGLHCNDRAYEVILNYIRTHTVTIYN